MKRNLEKMIQRAARYAAAPGASYSSEQAQVIGCEFETMLREGVPVTPSAVVDRARDEDTSLHPFFDWNNETAAESWRRQEARSLINHLVIITQTPTGEIQTKAAFSVYVMEPEEESERTPQYISVTQVLQNEDYLQQLKAQAWSELRNFRQKYGGLGINDFLPIYSFVDGQSK